MTHLSLRLKCVFGLLTVKRRVLPVPYWRVVAPTPGVVPFRVRGTSIMWLCFMASSPMRAVYASPGRGSSPPAGSRFASPASHRAVGFHALMGYGLPVPFLVIALGMVGTCPQSVDGQGNRPVNSLHADLAYGPRASVCVRKILTDWSCPDCGSEAVSCVSF